MIVNNREIAYRCEQFTIIEVIVKSNVQIAFNSLLLKKKKNFN